MILEACVETLEEAICAEKNGAHQLELCSDLTNDGYTPSLELTKQIIRHVNIPVKVMIRTDNGDFTCNQAQLELMKEQIHQFNNLNVRGYVFGILTHEKEIDFEKINDLCSLIKSRSITFHKAIDQTNDIINSSIKLANTCKGVNYILSSGGQETAKLGVENLRKIQEKVGAKLDLIAAGCITQSNLTKLHEQLDFSYYHGRQIVGLLT